MSEDQVIELVTEAFDTHDEWALVQTLGEVVGVFKSLEAVLESNDLVLESELDESDFDEVEVSEDPEEERSEIAFHMPIANTFLQLEFTYWKTEEGYHIWADCDYYLDQDDEDSDND